MEFTKASEIYSLNKSTYINLRWIAYIGQLTAIIVVQFILQFDFKYFACISVIFLSIATNIYLLFRVKENQLNNITSSSYLGYDIAQLSILFFFTGGITNPFIFLIIIPAVFSSQYLNIWSSITLVIFTVILLLVLTFF